MSKNSRGKSVDIPAVAATKARNEFNDLLARMQTPKARKAMKTAFNASPAELGRAAGKAARKAH
jgi:hypothetical protein